MFGFVRFDTPWVLALSLVLAIAFAFGVAKWVPRGLQRQSVRWNVRFSESTASAKLTRGRDYIPVPLVGLTVLLWGVLFAGPLMRGQVPLDSCGMVLSIDRSSSMTATDVQPSRYDAATAAVAEAFASLNAASPCMASLVTFSDNAESAVPMTPVRDNVLVELESFEFSEDSTAGTNTQASLEIAIASATEVTEFLGRPADILLLSDGDESGSSDAIAAAAVAKEKGVSIHTVAYGQNDGKFQAPNGQMVPAPPNQALMQEIADATGGSFYEAGSAEEIVGVFDEFVREQAFEEAWVPKFWPFLIPAALSTLALIASLTPWVKRGQLKRAADMPPVTEADLEAHQSGSQRELVNI